MNEIDGEYSLGTGPIRTGEVIRRLAGSRYEIRVGSQAISAAGGAEDLAVGTRVTLNQTSSGWIIVESGRVRTRKVVEVRVDG